MTPETIKAAFDAESWSSANQWDIQAMRRVLTRILCPAPAARPDSAGEGGKDRAGEMAEQIITLYCSSASGGAAVSFGMGYDGMLLRPVSRGCDEAIRAMQNVFAEALRVYGDEVLEKAATKLGNYGGTVARSYAAGIVRDLKSSPTGATNV